MHKIGCYRIKCKVCFYRKCLSYDTMEHDCGKLSKLSKHLDKRVGVDSELNDSSIMQVYEACKQERYKTRYYKR